MTPLRIVLDSNVVISAFLFGGPPARLIQHMVAGAVLSFTSVPIIDEIRDVLRRPKFGLPPEQAIDLVEELHDLCRIVSTGERVRAVAADPDDDIVLECALAANADVIVSGDCHLLDLREWRGMRILSPSEAISEIESRKG